MHRTLAAPAAGAAYGNGRCVQVESGFESTEKQYDVDTLTGQELLEMDVDQLDEIFSGAAAPQADEMSGRFRATLLAGVAHDYMPDVVKKAWNFLVSSPMMPWKGVEFEQGDAPGEIRGTQLFVSSEKPVKLMKFEGGIESSAFDSADCLALNYAAPLSLPLPRLKDELRKVNSFLYIGRGYAGVGEEPAFLTYFSIEPEY